MMGNTWDRSWLQRTGLKKGLSSPSLLLSTRSQDWKWAAKPSRYSGQDQRSNAALELDANIPGRVWIRHVELQVICGTESESCQAGQLLRHLQDHCPLEANKQLIGQGFHTRLAGKQVMYWICFVLFCFSSRKHCFLVLNLLTEN